jgi:predicted nucleotidyltransferase
MLAPSPKPKTRPKLDLAPKPKRAKKLDLAPILPLLDLIRASWDPHQVWLFGSRARGTATPQSDWDLLVVVPDDLAPALEDPLVPWRLTRQARARADVIPCGERDFKAAAEVPNLLSYEAKHHGILLYERATL